LLFIPRPQVINYEKIPPFQRPEKQYTIWFDYAALGKNEGCGLHSLGGTLQLYNNIQYLRYAVSKEKQSIPCIVLPEAKVQSLLTN